MKDREYVERERREYARRLVEIERASKADKLEAAAEFEKSLTEHPWIIVERMRWMLEGHYGYGAAEAANRVLTASKKANKKAMLFQQVGRIEWSCPVYYINKAWKEICKHDLVYTSLDLYRCGILFFDPSLNKQHVVLQVKILD